MISLGGTQRRALGCPPAGGAESRSLARQAGGGSGPSGSPAAPLGFGSLGLTLRDLLGFICGAPLRGGALAGVQGLFAGGGPAPAKLLDSLVPGVSTDSRTVREGELFVALKGPSFDGSRFVGGALAKGALAAVAAGESREELASGGADLSRVAFVPDTLYALGSLAQGLRKALPLTVAAITGSVGKTTAKELLKCVLEAEFGEGRALATPGNFNNLVGLPLTLFQLSSGVSHAALELGANAFGEIARLTEIAAPDLGLITRAAPAHLEGFGSAEGVAKAKGELWEGLGEAAIAAVNVSDPLLAERGMGFRGNIVTFGRRQDGAQYYVSEGAASGPGRGALAKAEPGRAKGAAGEFFIFGPGLPAMGLAVSMKLLGAHSRENALAAACAASALGCGAESVKRGLEAATPPPGRGELIADEASGVTLLDDSYNANPLSMRAALELARSLQFSSASAVLGSMLELGPGAEEAHYELGLSLGGYGIGRLALVGPFAERVREGAIRGGLGKKDVGVFADPLEAFAFVRSRAQRGELILVKGSHSNGLTALARAFSGENDAL